MSVFIFNFPLGPENFKPSFVFLGPILKQQDIWGNIPQPPAPTGATFFASNPSDKGAQAIFYLPEKTGYRFIQATDQKPVFQTSSTQGKVVTKSLFDIASSETPVKASKDFSETDYKIDAYKPLGLVPDDPN